MLIERDTELTQLSELLDGIQDGRGKIALITGEAGIGKSSLLSAIRMKALQKYPALNWVSGGCDAMFTPRTLGLVHDMAPALGIDVQAAMNSEADRAVLFSAILAALSNNGPTVLACEDLHWADHATIDLLKYVARRLSLLPALMIITFRDDEVDVSHPLNQFLGNLPGQLTTRLPLAPLSESAVSALTNDRQFDAALLHQVTNGNPFYVTELLASDTTETDVPASVRDAVTLRLGQLKAEEREFLERVSVFPGAPTYGFLKRLLGEEVFDLAAQCVSKQLLVEDGGRIRFRHELARLATLDRISPARRRIYHADCLKVLIGQNGNAPVEQIVHHASGAYQGEMVLNYAPLAARAAAQAGSHREAAAHYATALKFVDDAAPEQAAELYEAWAYEAALSERIDEEVLEARRHALTLWRALGRQEKVGENLRHLSRLHWYRGESAEATRFADQAIRVLEATPASPEHAMAYSLRSQLHMLNDKMDDAIEWGERALAGGDNTVTPEIRIHALNNIGTARIFRGDQKGLAQLQESLDLSLAHGHHEHAARAYNNLAEYAVEFCEFELAEKTQSDGLAFDTEHDLDAWTYYLSGRLALLRLQQGRITDAINISIGVLAIDRLSLLMKLPAQLVLARAYMRRGNPKTQSVMLDALSNALATDELQHIVPARMTLIESAWISGEYQKGIEHLQALLELSVADRHPWNIGARAVWAKRFGLVANVAHNLPAPFALELAGHPTAAANEWDQLGLPYEASMVRLAYPDSESLPSLIRSLRDMDARLALEKARQLAKEAGLKTENLKSPRGPYKATRSHPLGLTAKEQSVLKHLSDGLSNREIADLLSRSPRTIEHHVSSILGKLNATNRMAAVLRVQSEPWLISE